MRSREIIKTGMCVLSANLTGKRTPLAVYLSVTDRCPLRCAYCNIPQKKKQQELSTSQIFSIIDQISKQTVRFHIVGGEPMLREDIGEIIDYAKKKGLYTTMSTTGFNFDKKQDDVKKLDMVLISFDGEKDVHEKHKGKGSYDIFMKAMEIMKANNMKFMTNTALTKLNKDSIDFIIETAKKNRFLAGFQPLYFTDDPIDEHLHLAKIPSLVMKDDEYRAVLKKLAKEKRKGSPISCSLPFLDYLMRWKDFDKVYSPMPVGSIKCWAGKLYCYIDTDGSLYPCVDSMGRVKGLKVQEVGFRKAFEFADKRPCNSCVIACDVEQNLMFSLDIKTIFNWIGKV